MAQEFASDNSKTGLFSRLKHSQHRGFFSFIFVTLSVIFILITFAAVQQQQTTQSKAATNLCDSVVCSGSTAQSCTDTPKENSCCYASTSGGGRVGTTILPIVFLGCKSKGTVYCTNLDSEAKCNAFPSQCELKEDNKCGDVPSCVVKGQPVSQLNPKCCADLTPVRKEISGRTVYVCEKSTTTGGTPTSIGINKRCKSDTGLIIGICGTTSDNLYCDSRVDGGTCLECKDGTVTNDDTCTKTTTPALCETQAGPGVLYYCNAQNERVPCDLVNNVPKGSCLKSSVVGQALPSSGTCNYGGTDGTWKSGLCPGGSDVRCCSKGTTIPPIEPPIEPPIIPPTGCSSYTSSGEAACNAVTTCEWKNNECVNKTATIKTCEDFTTQSTCLPTTECKWLTATNKCMKICSRVVNQNVCTNRDDCIWVTN